MTATILAALLPFAVLAACLFRARLLALALIPPCALILARSLEFVDISSASHPLRWIVPVMMTGLAGMALWREGCLPVKPSAAQRGFTNTELFVRYRDSRALVASLLVLGSCAPDLLALHPWFWARFAEWPLVPIQIAVCGTILAVLLAPERWVAKCIK
jgi:hypothetical protein